MQYQLLPDLAGDEYEELKQHIADYGVLVPVEYDEYGNILDGHHRVRACGELGIQDWPRVVRTGLSEEQKQEHILALNLARRHLSREQRQALVATLRAQGWSTPRIAESLHISEATAWRDAVSGSSNEEAATVIGKDGKTYPAQRGVEEGEPRMPPLWQGDDSEETLPAEKAREKSECHAAVRERGGTSMLMSPPILLPSAVQVFCRDSRDLSPLTDESMHLVITSPPYNVGKDYRMYEDHRTLADYLAMLDGVWSECWRVLVPGGRLCVNVPHGTDRNPYFPIGAHVTLQLANRFDLLGTVIWDKGSTGNRTSWGSWRLPTAPSLRDTCELVIVVAKGGRFTVPEGVLVPDGEQRVSPWLSAEQFTTLTQDHWAISPESAERIGHPAPFPVELAARLLRLYGFPGCTVLDPFGGSGTVGVAALQLGAQAVLVDIDEQYCQLARRRCYAHG